MVDGEPVGKASGEEVAVGGGDGVSRSGQLPGTEWAKRQGHG